jgi:mannitol-1-phosphate 5-dehydrogenase
MRTFVGFGFGPIQAGLFLAEAQESGNFRRLVVAEVQADVVTAVRRNGTCLVNIGHEDRIESRTISPLEMLNPAVETDRDKLIAAIAEAQEMATALPSIATYQTGGDTSVAAILAMGLRQKAAMSGPNAIVYTAENHTVAAEHLLAAIMEFVPAAERAAVLARVQVLDTVIGKMSGVPSESDDLPPLAPGLSRSYLVEAFSRIYISRILRPGMAGAAGLDSSWATFARGIQVFIEKDDLRPFAEAKLYGHNAGHALAGYLARAIGLTRIDQLRKRPDVIDFVRNAMVIESGRALIAQFEGVDPIFTPAGFAGYAGDLVRRMVNPNVRDTVARVCRDPERKIDWDDRLVGAMRLAVGAGVEPRRYALGVAAALQMMGISYTRQPAYLRERWSAAGAPAAEQEQLLPLIVTAGERLRSWRQAGFPELV